MTENTFFDYWRQHQDAFYKHQNEWLESWTNTDDQVSSEYLEISKKSWALCEEQYRSWMKAAENWFDTGMPPTGDDEEQNASQMLLFMLNPENFSRFGFDQMNSFFMKLVNGPEFADIGMLEKKFLKSGQDWLLLCDASEEYQSVLAAAWNRAFKLYADEFLEQGTDSGVDAKNMLQRWLEIAESELIKTLRSTDFLAAQRNFFKAATGYKTKQQEFTELWCETHGIPTRSEVDELHKIIHEQRREIRKLGQAIKNLSPVPVLKKTQAVFQKQSRQTAPKKSTRPGPAKSGLKTAKKGAGKTGTGKTGIRQQ